MDNYEFVEEIKRILKINRELDLWRFLILARFMKGFGTQDTTMVSKRDTTRNNFKIPVKIT